MSCEPVIRARKLGKCYQLYAQPQDRLKQFLWRGKRRFFREFWALHEVSFEVMPGEVVGIVGRNGSGKSTLLQLICGTLTPTNGEVEVRGRVAALLELGAGFNPEFTGRENVFMSAAVMGLSEAEIAARYEDIVDFSGIRDFIDQPVKTYSSGMYVRLAFSVAISVDPDILVIDEALSVGDGAFARKSFDRIMALKEAGKTILFCSHSMYQVEAICNRAMWIREGRIAMMDVPGLVVNAYNTYLASHESTGKPQPEAHAPSETVAAAAPGTGRITQVTVCANGHCDRALAVRTLEADVTVTVSFVTDPALPPPAVALGILTQAGVAVTSAGSHNDGVTLGRNADGSGSTTLVIPKFPLLKGDYFINVFLLCERGVHIYDHAEKVAELQVSQRGLEQGLVTLPHRWETVP